jgi:cytochrome c oxidase accessory protein FixG
MAVHLPVLDEPTGSLRKDGSREAIHPADVRGRFTRLRHALFVVLIAVYVALPFVQVGGRPAVFLDVPKRLFFLFGASFNAQDFWLVFFLLTAVGFGLFLATTLAGRVWCGYACPQTVYLEGVYRRIERWLEGPRQVRLRRNRGPLTVGKVSRKTLKHALFVLVSVVLSHFFLSYFVSLPSLWQMMHASPAEHPVAFGWMLGTSVVLYLNFAWFREQLCLVVCPYGRLQSLLTDSDTLGIGYDTGRGEPRGKLKDPSAGDCIDCSRCVVVCPTGIDIRNGLQLDCIGCAACVDACDEVMTKVGRPRGLVRYDSQRGLEGEGRRILRPRLALYAALGVVGLVVATFAFRSHAPYEANLLRMPGPPYVVEGDRVRNGLQIHLVNKRDEEVQVRIEPIPDERLTHLGSARTVRLRPLADMHVPLFVTAPRSPSPNGHPVRIRVEPTGATARELSAPFLAPGK